MKLTEKDYENIAAQIEEGGNSIEYEKDGETLFLECSFSIEGYIEDDYHCGYMNGTGAWIETERWLDIESAEVMDEEENVTPIFVDGGQLAEYVE